MMLFRVTMPEGLLRQITLALVAASNSSWCRSIVADWRMARMSSYLGCCRIHWMKSQPVSWPGGSSKSQINSAGFSEASCNCCLASSRLWALRTVCPKRPISLASEVRICLSSSTRRMVAILFCCLPVAWLYKWTKERISLWFYMNTNRCQPELIMLKY